MLRWLFRIFLTLLVLIVLAAIAVQAVLWTNLPRTMVINQVQKELKLRVTCEKLSTSWSGHTTLTNVTVSMPLNSGSFLRLGELKVHHASLIALLFGRPMDVKELELDKPQLVVQQDAAGRWNLQDVLELVRRAAGSNEADAKAAQQGKSEAIVLPHITVTDGTVDVIDHLGQKAVIAPINASGQAEGPLVYTYDLAVGNVVAETNQQASASPESGDADASTLSVVEASQQAAAITHSPIYIKGRVVPGGVWQHELGISIHDLGPWLAPFVAPSLATKLATVSFAGHWRGGVYGSAVIGRLDIQQASTLAKSAHGGINLTMQDGTLIARPDDLRVDTHIPMLPEVRLTDGSVYCDGVIVRATGLIAQLAAGRIKIDGNFDFREQNADVTVDWDRINAPGPLAGFVQAGRLAASYRHTWAGQTLITSDITTSGVRLSDGENWDMTAKLSGQGNFATQFAWTLTASKLHLAAGKILNQKGVDLDGLTASVLQAGNQIALQSLAIPTGLQIDKLTRGTLNAHGGFDQHASTWNVVLSAQNWKWRSDVLAFDLNANGNLKAAHVEKFSATFGKVRIRANGTISAPPEKTKLNILCTYPPFNLESYRGGLPLQGGEFASELTLEGDLSQRKLEVSGHLHGKDLMLAGHRLGDFSMQVSKMHIDSQMAELEPTTIKLFGGKWIVRGQYRFGASPTGQQTTPGAQLSTAMQAASPVEQTPLLAVTAQLNEMSLARVDDFFTPPRKIDGTLSGACTVTMHNNDLNDLDISGPFHLTNIQTSGFKAAHIDGQVRVADGQVTILPIVVRSAESPEDGAIDASVWFAIHTPAQMQISATAIAWPIVLAGNPQVHAPFPADDGRSRQPATAPSKTAPPGSAPATEPDDGKLPMVRFSLPWNATERSRPGPAAVIKIGWRAANLASARAVPRNLFLLQQGRPPVSLIALAAASQPMSQPSTKPGDGTLLARVWAHVDMQLNVSPFQIQQGPITGGRLVLWRGQQQLLDLHAQGSISDEQLIVDSLRGSLIGGTVEGSATLFLDGAKIFQSRAHLGFGGIDASRIVELIPAARGLMGVFGGKVDLNPTTDPRALGKSQLLATINVAGGHWNSVQIGNASLTAYFDREPPGPISPSAQVAARAAAATRAVAQPPQPIAALPGSSLESIRAVLDDSRFEIGGGIVHLWARYARPDNEPFVNVRAQFADLDLNQLIRGGQESASTQPIAAAAAPSPAKAPEIKSYPGQLAGTVAIFGNPQRPKDLFGQGSMKITHTDLAGTNIIGALYSIMSFHFGHSNEGRGSADLRLDAGRLEITRFYYFNQGLEARGDASIFNFWNGLKDAEIKGQVVGSVRPLRDLKLPFAADADKILSVLQSNVTTVGVEGHLSDPQVHPAAFSDISDALRQILVGDAEHNPQ